MKIAFYRSTSSNLFLRAIHSLVKLRTRSSFSHCELVIDGICYSSSWQDGGVRAQEIDLGSGRWALVEIEGDEDAARRWFLQNDGQRYDYLGVFLFLLGRRIGASTRWFCSSAVASALNIPEPLRYSPQTLYERVTRPRSV